MSFEQIRRIIAEQFQIQSSEMRVQIEAQLNANKDNVFQSWPAKKIDDDVTTHTVDLINDVDCRKPHLWLKNCVNVVFTEKEIQNGCFIASNRSNRPPMDPVRVRMLKACFRDKYKNKEKTNDDIWSIVCEAVNTKGRGFVFRVKKALRLSNNSQ
jgi:hypothetical protein